MKEAVRLFLKFYLWLKSKFNSKNMANEQMFPELLQVATKRLSDFISYLRAEETKGYLKCINDHTIKNDRVEFNVGLQTFLLKLSINISQLTYTLQTFEIIDNVNDYGRKALLSNPELDINGDFENLWFKEDKTQDYFNRPIKVNIIQQFGREYTYQLQKMLVKSPKC